MARIAQENLWQHPGFPGLIVVTTNGVVKKNGALVMGRGAALQATQRIQGIEFECGRKIRKVCENNSRAYGFLIVRPVLEAGKVGFGIFQVKWHWAEDANLDLIRYSAKKLALFADRNPDVSIRLNYPGIGNGKLSKAEVEPLLTELPRNVTVCYR